jgi:hypothetical protein
VLAFGLAWRLQDVPLRETSGQSSTTEDTGPRRQVTPDMRRPAHSRAG